MGNTKKFSTRKIVSLILKLIVTVFAVSGTVISMNSGSDSFMGGTTLLMYFTIQSNIALAALSLIGGCILIFRKNVPDWWYTIKFVGTLSITLTGGVFAFVLAPTLGGMAWNSVNVYTHVIVPIAAVLDFFVIGIDSDIKKKKVFYVTIPPILYVIYAAIGYAQKWEFSPGVNYPYFFLNWGSPAGAFGFSNELPFMGCMWWILLLTVILILIGLLYLAVLKGIKKLST